MKSAVLDTNVLLQAVGRPQSLCARILPRSGEFELCASAEAIEEFVGVSSRASVQRKLRSLTSTRVEAMVEVLQAGHFMTDVPEVRACRDPDDDKSIACALAARADFLVTEDQDLLALDGYEGLRIVAPAQFLEALGQSPGE